MRISLGGGGTDLHSYYAKNGGFLVAAAIDKYVFLAANKRFYPSIRLSYSETEIVDSVDEIKHKIFKAALCLLDISFGIELVSIADMPANSGLGTSSSFTVSLLNALHAYKREYVALRQLAEEACHLEIDVLGEPIGKQDQYMAAFGGVTALTFEKTGEVHVEPIPLSDSALYELENNTLLFYTGIERSASSVLSEQNEKTREDDAKVLNSLNIIKDIGLQTYKAFKEGNIDVFGELLDYHWQTKKKLSNKVSNPKIDEWYTLARANGAIGGKIMGAGGGGFFMFYCKDGKHQLTQVMERAGLKRMRYRFDFEGAKTVANIKQS